MDTTYTIVRIGRATTKHFAPVIDLGNGKTYDNANCRFSNGRITWRSEPMTREEALAKTTCRHCRPSEMPACGTSLR